MTVINSSWTLAKQVYVGNDGYHDVYWRMYARIVSQSGGNTTVGVTGRIYVSGSESGYCYCGPVTTTGGVVGNYSAWGIDSSGTYYVGETDLWYGSDTTSGSYMSAGIRFYSSPWGWTGDNLYISDTFTFADPIPTPDLTGIGVTPTTATIGWFVDDGVGSLNGTGYIYGGTTASPTTQLFTTTLKNDTFVDTGLTPNTQYYYRGRIKDSNNNWGPYTPLDLRLTTLAEPGKLYGSVNGQSKKVQKLYGSVGGQTKEIVKLYGSVNGQTKLIYSK
jgi:hypothetical protein